MNTVQKTPFSSNRNLQMQRISSLRYSAPPVFLALRRDLCISAVMFIRFLNGDSISFTMLQSAFSRPLSRSASSAKTKPIVFMSIRQMRASTLTVLRPSLEGNAAIEHSSFPALLMCGTSAVSFSATGVASDSSLRCSVSIITAPFIILIFPHVYYYSNSWKKNNDKYELFWNSSSISS